MKSFRSPSLNHLLPVACLAAGLAQSAFSEEGKDSLQFSKPSFKISQEVTHVVKGGAHIKSDGGLDGAWIEPTSASLGFQARKNDRLGLDITVAATYFSAPYHYDVPQNYVRNISVTAPRLDISYLFGDVEHPFLRADAGIFGVKYNDYARNLGDYMFRTWAYPGIIQTGGSFAYLGANTVPVTGLRLSQNMGQFSHELVVSVETELTPVYDVNLTYMARYNFNNILKIGGGVQLARLLSADKEPKMRVHYYQHNGVWYVAGDAGSAYYSNLAKGIEEEMAKPGLSLADSNRLATELAQDSVAIRLYEDSISTSLLNPSMKTLTARAIKPVLYFSFDPKPLFNADVFGPKDMILYGEAAILGTQNYPVFYKEIARRIPMMVGFNVPTFKLLDVLSVELEYYRSQWLPTYRNSVELNASPAPFMPIAYYPTQWDKDNLKWSIYAERGILNGITLSAQMASDHSRSWDWNSYGKTSWEIYTTPSQYYWGLKLSAAI